MYFARGTGIIFRSRRARVSDASSPGVPLRVLPGRSKNAMLEAFVSQTKQPAAAELCYTEA